MARYVDIARDLQKRIDAGEWTPGVKLPPVRKLSSDYGVRPPVIVEAYAVLGGWGYISVRRGASAVVLDRGAPKTPLPIGRVVDRNEFGYVYNPSAGHWPPVKPPARAWVELRTVPEVARMLEVDPRGRVLARHRVVGPEGTDPAQTTTTYLVEWLGRQLDVDDTGPGGWIDQVEQRIVPGPVRWRRTTTSRLPREQEARDLGITLTSPVLVVAFTVTGHKQRSPLAVDVMTFDASRFELEDAVTRSADAKWPVRPATERNAPVSDSK